MKNAKDRLRLCERRSEMRCHAANASGRGSRNEDKIAGRGFTQFANIAGHLLNCEAAAMKRLMMFLSIQKQLNR